MNDHPSLHDLQTRARTRWLIMAAVAGLALIILLANSCFARLLRAPRPEPGDPAPEFTLTTFDNAQIALKDLRGQVVVLYFWASWSAPVRREAPAMEALWMDYQDRGVTLIGIAAQDAQAASRDYVREVRPSYPNGSDPLDQISSSYGVTVIPETFVIGPEGQIVWVRVGEIRADELREQLDRLVGGEAVKSPATLVQEIDVIAQRLRDELTASAIPESKARSPRSSAPLPRAAPGPASRSAHGRPVR
jgi:peroxiredoxin